MTHAKRGHDCTICGKTSFGNGGKVAHARGHVRRGEAVELVKFYGYDISPSRIFLAPADEDVERLIAKGYEQVAAG